jgi:hypothetical protein
MRTTIAPPPAQGEFVLTQRAHSPNAPEASTTPSPAMLAGPLLALGGKSFPEDSPSPHIGD